MPCWSPVKILLLWLLCLQVMLPLAASPQAEPHFARMQHLADTLALSHHATTVVQDLDGFFWLGTQHGLYRFDGAELRQFRADALDPGSLSADWITELLVDRAGSLWIGTRYAGLNRFDPQTERFERISVAGETAASRLNIARLYLDGAGELWVAAYGEGLFRWSDSQQQLVAVALPPTIDGVSTAYINDILQQDDSLWLAIGNAPLRSKAQATGGLIRWSLSQQQGEAWQRQNSPLDVDSVTSLLPTAQGLLVGSYGSGLWQITAAGPVALQQPAELQDAQVTALKRDQQGLYWFSTYDQGLWSWQPETAAWRHYRAHPEVPVSLRSNAIQSLYLDPQQSLWLITPSGFVLFNQIAREVRILPAGSDPQLLPAANVLGISVVADNVWLANREAGVVRFHPASGELQHFPLPELENGPTLARAILADNGWVWVGTDRGLFKLNPESGYWQRYELGPELAADLSVGVIISDRQQRLWLGTRGQGVLLLSPERQLLRQFAQDTEPALPFSSVSTLLFDQQDRLWVGSPDSGLWRWDERSGRTSYWLQRGDSQHGLLFNNIQLLFEEQQRIWIRAGNLNHRWLDNAEPGSAEFFSYQPMQADDALIAAPWFRLMYRQQWLAEMQSMLELGAGHGMQEATWIGAWTVADGWLFRGGSQGLDMFRPQQLPGSLALPEVRLTSFALFNQQVPVGSALLPQAIHRLSALTLKYKEDVFSLRFASPTFLLPAQLEYRYRLQGFDRDWLMVSNQERLATYTRLPPGDYQFELEVRLRQGEWQPGPRLTIRILPPWWMTWWFRSLMLLSLVFAIWLWLHLKVKAERQMRLKLQQQVAERTQELKEKHDALQASNQDLLLLQQIGREITGSLQLGQVLSRCHQMLSQLIDVHAMVIGLHRPLTNEIEFVFWLEDSETASSFAIAANDGKAPASLCFCRAEEIIVNQHSDFATYFDELPQPLCGEAMESVVYLPLMLNQKVVGVFSVQSPRAFAYSRSQLNLLRTLSSYIAIAVVNADTYTRLQQTQQQLVIQEKMASLGALVAGVAHEINTPLGICVTATSHLQAEYNVIQQAFNDKSLQQSQFQRFLSHLGDGLKILAVNTERSAALIQSFKKVSVDQSADAPRQIELASYLQDVMLSLQPQLRPLNCQFQLVCPADIHWYTDAGALAQILTNLVMNSVKHAFAEQSAPAISLQVQQQGRQLLFDYADNGCGMDEQNLALIFEPFFTTKRAAGGTGLGAHIVFNLVTARFKGQIQVQSTPGQGLHYRISLPLDAC